MVLPCGAVLQKVSHKSCQTKDSTAGVGKVCVVSHMTLHDRGLQPRVPRIKFNAQKFRHNIVYCQYIIPVISSNYIKQGTPIFF